MRKLALGFTLALLSVYLALPSTALAADVFGKQPVKTVAIGDVTIELAGGDGSTVAQVAASNGAAAGNGLFVLAGVANSTLPSLTAGRAAGASIDLGGRMYVTGDASMTALLANITKVSGSTLSLGQTTMSASLPVVLASNQSTLAVTSGAPSGSGFLRNAATNIGSGASSTIVCKSGLSVSQPTKPLQYIITSGGAVRCTLQFNDNATLTKFADVATAPGDMTVVWTPPSGVVGLTTSSTVTTLQYEAACTNFDSVAQDVYCSVSYCQSASGC